MLHFSITSKHASNEHFTTTFSRRNQNHAIMRCGFFLKEASKEEPSPRCSPLWRMVTLLPHVFENEVVPKLDRNTVKFLRMTCRDARDVVRRRRRDIGVEGSSSSERIAIEKYFRIDQLQTASQVQLEYEVMYPEMRKEALHASVRSRKNEYFVVQLALVGKCEFVQFLVRKCKAPVDKGVLQTAALSGCLELVRFLVEGKADNASVSNSSCTKRNVRVGKITPT